MWRSFGQQRRMDKKKSVSNLLFEKILRSYQVSERVHKIKEKAVRRQENCGENRITVVDLNKKIKILRQVEREQGNKQNIQDNGTTYFQQSADGGNKNIEIECESIQEIQGIKNKNIKDHFNVNQFQILNDVDAHNIEFKVEFKKTINEDILHDLQNESNQNFNQSRFKVVEKMIVADQQLPFLKFPSIQLPSCLVGDEPPLQDFVFSQPAQKFQKNCQQLEGKPIDEYLNLKPSTVQGKEVQISSAPKIKNKISLRVLKRKLKKSSPQEILQDIMKHRKILLQGSSGVQDRQSLENALMSLLKKVDN